MELGASKRTSSAEPLSRRSKNESKNESKQSAARTRAGLVDATVYDFERLERAVSMLAAQHAQATNENALLRDEAALRESRISELEAKLKAAEDRRQAVLGRIDALMTEFDRLETLPADSHQDPHGV